MKTELVSEPQTPQESIPTTVSRMTFSDIFHKQGNSKAFSTHCNQELEITSAIDQTMNQRAEFSQVPLYFRHIQLFRQYGHAKLDSEASSELEYVRGP